MQKKYTSIGLTVQRESNVHSSERDRKPEDMIPVTDVYESVSNPVPIAYIHYFLHGLIIQAVSDFAVHNN